MALPLPLDDKRSESISDNVHLFFDKSDLRIPPPCSSTTNADASDGIEVILLHCPSTMNSSPLVNENDEWTNFIPTTWLTQRDDYGLLAAEHCISPTLLTSDANKENVVMFKMKEIKGGITSACHGGAATSHKFQQHVHGKWGHRVNEASLHSSSFSASSSCSITSSCLLLDDKESLLSEGESILQPISVAF